MRPILALCALVLLATIAWLLQERLPLATPAGGNPVASEQGASGEQDDTQARARPASTDRTLGAEQPMRAPAANHHPRGRVVEWGSNQPVSVTLVATEIARSAPAAETLLLAATSDHAGWFQFAEPLHPGWWRLSTLEGRRVVRPTAFRIEAADDPAPLHVIVDDGHPGDTIGGRVIDGRNGKGVGDVVVLGRSEGVLSATSDDEGRFWLQASSRERSAVELTIALHWARRGLEGFPYEMTFPVVVELGVPNVEIVLRRAATFALHVEDDRGRPLENFAAAVVGPFAGGDLPLRPEAYPGGVATFDCVAEAHDYVALVAPSDPELFPSPPVLIRRAGGQPDRLRVGLQRRKDTALRCVDPRGQPVAGALVSVLHAVPLGWRNLQLPGVPIEQLTHLTEQDVSYAEGTTDAEGRVTLRLPSSLVGYSVRVSGPGARYHEHAGGSLDLRADPVVLAVPDGGTLVVRVANLDPVGCTVRLQRDAPAGALWLPLVSHAPWLFDANHSASIRGIPAGQWTAFLVAENDHTWRVGSVEARDGSAHELWFDGGGFRLENVHVRVEVDGQPAASMVIEDAPVVPGGHVAKGLCEVAGERGDIDAGLTPGPLRLLARMQEATGTGCVPLGVVDVIRNGNNDFAFAVRRERRHARLVDVKQRPLPWLPVVVVDSAGTTTWTSRTDRDGNVVLDWLPAAGEVHVLPRDFDMLRWRLSAEQEVRLRRRIASVADIRASADAATMTVR